PSAVSMRARGPLLPDTMPRSLAVLTDAALTPSRTSSGANGSRRPLTSYVRRSAASVAVAASPTAAGVGLTALVVGFAPAAAGFSAAVMGGAVAGAAGVAAAAVEARGD